MNTIRSLGIILQSMGDRAYSPAALDSEAGRVEIAANDMRAQGLPGVADHYRNVSQALRECATIAREIQP